MASLFLLLLAKIIQQHWTTKVVFTHWSWEGIWRLENIMINEAFGLKPQVVNMGYGDHRQLAQLTWAMTEKNSGCQALGQRLVESYVSITEASERELEVMMRLQGGIITRLFIWRPRLRWSTCVHIHACVHAWLHMLVSTCVCIVNTQCRQQLSLWWWMQCGAVVLSSGLSWWIR